MVLEWSRLRVLDAVARTGSVTRAAAILHLTGPAVSQQLRRIEREAGVRVVIPAGRGLRLTSEGRLLADYASQVAELMMRAQNDLQHEEELVGQVRIGALASFLRASLVQTLASFQRSHPRVGLRIEDGETDRHLELLSNARLDLVFAESWSTAPLRLPAELAVRRLSREQAWIALPERHPLSGQEQLGFSDLASAEWATCAPDSDGHQALAQAARRAGIEPDIRHFVADQATQLALVQAGLAVACIPYPAQPSSAVGIVFRALATPMHRDLLLLSDGRTTPRTVEALIGHLADPGLAE